MTGPQRAELRRPNVLVYVVRGTAMSPRAAERRWRQPGSSDAHESRKPIWFGVKRSRVTKQWRVIALSWVLASSNCWLPAKWRIQFKLASLIPTKSYTPVLRHICLNASIPTFLLAPCDHHTPLSCASPALIFILVHARFILQLQQSRILSLPLFVRLKP